MYLYNAEKEIVVRFFDMSVGRWMMQGLTPRELESFPYKVSPLIPDVRRNNLLNAKVRFCMIGFANANIGISNALRNQKKMMANLDSVIALTRKARDYPEFSKVCLNMVASLVWRCKFLIHTGKRDYPNE